MNKSLLDEVKGVSVDLTYMGFTLIPDVPFASDGDGCSSCSSCGSH